MQKSGARRASQSEAAYQASWKQSAAVRLLLYLFGRHFRLFVSFHFTSEGLSGIKGRGADFEGYERMDSEEFRNWFYSDQQRLAALQHGGRVDLRLARLGSEPLI